MCFVIFFNHFVGVIEIGNGTYMITRVKLVLYTVGIELFFYLFV